MNETLSDKIINHKDGYALRPDDVKAFIKELKKGLDGDDNREYKMWFIHSTIDKLAGDKLI